MLGIQQLWSESTCLYPLLPKHCVSVKVIQHKKVYFFTVSPEGIQEWDHLDRAEVEIITTKAEWNELLRSKRKLQQLKNREKESVKGSFRNILMIEALLYLLPHTISDKVASV